MTAKKAAERLMNYNPNLDIQSCKDYGLNYLFTAFIKGDKNNWDPFYLVNKITGIVSDYSIIDNSDKYYRTKEIPFS